MKQDLPVTISVNVSQEITLCALERSIFQKISFLRTKLLMLGIHPPKPWVLYCESPGNSFIQNMTNIFS